ncbi:biotin--[acetyl-CoA-carboxylase] ligase [Oerskovia enterophila]|uniref:biotin--[biotin carboxyl-carrier protein] ligase n=1 Tax=Oerskovia enterophila TaxID=43678 RepID=A0A163QVA7_9CELL|nr:biotin--[acetyl-CoA-carboxylase] ligase [Oerskovia enterophila]KZM34572.1 bifunctional ligase/repressor BirA [Oerskovia enterophila]OCI29428.1 bifunctional ligase/repressor BirA [Oerskovia enterophila]
MTTADRPALRPDFLRDLLVVPHGPLERLEVVEESVSTNTELAAAVAADPQAWPAPALLVAEHQVGGRGRAGRTWETPARTALTGSLLVRPDVPRESLSWLPLLAGLATVRCLRATAGVEAVVKWPNDVLVPGPGAAAGGEAAEEIEGWGTYRKVAGILCELLPDGGAIVGVGLNVLQGEGELPVASATSLALAGAATTDREVLLTALEESFALTLGRWQDAGGDAEVAGLVAECVEVSGTIGAQVRVDLTGGGQVTGEADGFGPDGSLLVRGDDGTVRSLHSGDVHHLRLGSGSAAGSGTSSVTGGTASSGPVGGPVGAPAG